MGIKASEYQELFSCPKLKGSEIIKLSELKACPFCGYDEFYNYSGRTYCKQCNKYLGRCSNDKVGKAADKKWLYNSFQDESDEVRTFFEKALSNEDLFKKRVKAIYKQQKDLI